MSSRRLAIVALSLAAATGLATSASCTIFNGLTADPPDAAESGTGEAGEDAGADVRSTCTRTSPPEAGLAMPGGDGFTIVVAGKRIEFAVIPGAAIPGYDLDGVCTCGSDPDSCKRPETAAAGATCDGDGGLDNTLGDLAGTFEANLHLERISNEMILAGNTLLLRVEGYNGLPNDANVTVTVFTTLGAYRDAGAGAPEKVAPKFTNEDTWGIDTLAKEQAGVGYVVDSELVVKNMKTLTVGPGLSLTFQEGVISGRILPAGNGGFTLEQLTVAGRWPVDAALAALGQLKDQSGVTLCSQADGGGFTAQTYRALKSTLCSRVDIMQLGELDHKGAPCDALSGGARITAAPAQLDASFPMAGEAGASPCSDRCTN